MKRTNKRILIQTAELLHRVLLSLPFNNSTPGFIEDVDLGQGVATILRVAL